MNELKTAVEREVSTLKTPPRKEVAAQPVVGSVCPLSPELSLPRGKPAVVVFLRYCGDPFAEKNFCHLAALSIQQPGLACIAVSHCDRDVTDRWISEIGGAWNTDVVIDAERDVYARWGLGLNTTWQLYNPRALYTTFSLGRNEGIWSRTVENGSRWQMGGAFAVDAAGMVRWVHVPAVSDDVIDFDPMLALFNFPPMKKRKHQQHE